VPDHPETLAKFCTADTARKILSSHSLRWSAPNLFGDPFELNHQTSLSFDPHVMLDAVLRSAIGMIFSPDEPRGNSPLATVIRRWRDEERFANAEEAEEVLRELMGRMVDLRQVEIDELMTDWRRFTRQLRICCFSAKTDNLACWQRYSDNHRGLVIRFNAHVIAGDELTPQQIAYKNMRPEITTLRDQLGAVLNNEHVHPQELFQGKFLTKSPVTSHEQEWRCFYHAINENSGKETDDNLWFDDRPFERSAISAIYFGANMSAADKKTLLELIKKEYPSCKIFQAATLAGKYEIEFSRFTPA
jgi:hypothetical protein